MPTYQADERAQCVGCGAVHNLELLPDGWYRCGCRQEFQWPYPPDPGEVMEQRIGKLESALKAIRDRCTYSNLISQKREVRFVMTNAKEIIEIVDAALGEEKRC